MTKERDCSEGSSCTCGFHYAALLRDEKDLARPLHQKGCAGIKCVALEMSRAMQDALFRAGAAAADFGAAEAGLRFFRGYEF